MSIGGIELGDSLTQGRRAFGGGGECAPFEPPTGVTICTFGNFAGSRGGAEFYVFNDRISAVTLYAGVGKDGKARFEGPMLQFKTPRGDVGLGDRVRKVARSYPRGITIREPRYVRVLIEARNSSMDFGGDPRAGAVREHDGDRRPDSEDGRLITYIDLYRPG